LNVAENMLETAKRVAEAAKFFFFFERKRKKFSVIKRNELNEGIN
jgi:hypothetical protein